MLHLPTELVLKVLSFLPVRQILYLRLSSRAWNAFITENESSVYHAAAIAHNFSEPLKSLESQKNDPRSFWIQSVTSWKEYCHQYHLMEKRWTGKLPVKRASLSCLGRGVHRFKVDEEQRTVISTHITGGISVAEIENDQILWALPATEVRPYAHCEYGGGFLIFDRVGSTLEVWRHKRDARSDSLRASPGPDLLQERASQAAVQFSQSISQDDRGAFVPFTVITPPHASWAYRFVYPTLLVAPLEAHEVYLFDIPSAQLSQIITLDMPFKVHYVELSARHIFVCTEEQGLQIYSRTAECQPFRLEFEPYILSAMQSFGNFVHHYDPLTSHIWPGHSHGLSSQVLWPCTLRREEFDPEDEEMHPVETTAVHVSPCGSHLVCIGLDGYLHIIRDFALALSRPTTLGGSVTVIHMQTAITYMAFEEDRIVFYAANSGLFIIPFASQTRLPPDSLGTPLEATWPSLYQASRVLVQLPESVDPRIQCSCLQMTRTGVWYAPGELVPVGVDGAELFEFRRTLRYIDFTQSAAEICDQVGDRETEIDG